MNTRTKIHSQGEVFLYLSIMVCYCVLYAPQPMLSELADRFVVSKPEAGLLVSITFVPLAIAPLSYGIFLKQIDALTILKWALPLLAVAMAWSGFVRTYEAMLLLRLVQGFLLPAIITATMAYLASGRSGIDLSRVMSLYVAFTIFGGMAGRFFSGYIEHFFHWELVALTWAGLLFSVTFMPWRKATPKPLNLVKPDRSLIYEALTGRKNILVFISVFCMFWTFAGYLNYLPFRINEVESSATTVLVGQSYIGYSVGILSALSAGFLARQFGGPIRVVLLGFVIMIGSLVLALGTIWMLIAQVFVMCLGMFLVHTLAAGEVNHNAGSLGGVVNGLYVSCYYAGGALGAWLMGYIYDYFGWHVFLVVLAVVGGSGALCMWLYGRINYEGR